jgi:hypothetical protein
VGALALLVAVLILALGTGETRVPSQTLPDGTIVSIAKVSYGRTHSFTAGKLWERIAAQVLPETLKKRLGVRNRTYTFTNPTDSTVIFVQAVRSNGTFSAAPAMVSWFLTSGSSKDDVGNELMLQKLSESLLYSNVYVETFQVPLVSHLATQLQIDLTHNDYKSGLKSAATHFTLSNPAPRHGPGWIAPPLPQTNTAGDLTVEMLELSNRGGMAPNERLPLAGRVYPSIISRVRILRSGVPTAAWRVEGLTVMDEEGNAVGLFSSGASHSNVLEFGGGLSTREPRRFQFELARVAPFGPDETATLTNILVPTSADSKSYGQLASPITLEFQGFKLHVNRLNQMNDFQQIQLEYRITPPPRTLQHHIILKAVEGNGKETMLLDHNGGGSAGGNMGLGQSRPTVSGKYRVDLVFALTKSRMVEFLAKPEGAPIKNSK